MSNMQQHKCPCCGGAVEFDVGTQKLKCPYCNSEFEIASLQQAEQLNGNSVEDSINWGAKQTQWGSGETDGMVVYECNSCGGEIITDSTTSATKCPYCDNNVVMKGNFSGDLRPDLVIPFKLDKKAATQALKKYIAGKKFVPKIFKQDNHIDEIKGVYVPHWLFSCDAMTNVNYKAQRVRTWSDSNYNYTETSYYNIFRSGSISFDNVPVDGSTKMADDLMESIEPFDISQGVVLNTAYLAGYLADKYDVTVEQSIPRANERIKESALDAFRKTVEGYSNVTEENANVNSSNGTYKYALYPVWLLNTSWNGEKFTFGINGQTGKIVGNLPVDKGAIWKLRLLLTGVLGAVGYGLLWLIMFL